MSFAQAKKNDIAKHYVIISGHGHTTDVLRQKVKEEYPDIPVKDCSEAEIFNACLQKKYQIQADLLECNSTSCSNNITYLLELLEQNQIDATPSFSVTTTSCSFR